MFVENRGIVIGDSTFFFLLFIYAIIRLCCRMFAVLCIRLTRGEVNLTSNSSRVTVDGAAIVLHRFNEITLRCFDRILLRVRCLSREVRLGKIYRGREVRNI